MLAEIGSLATAEWREPASSDRLPVYRSESPTGYSLAGCSPAEPVSVHRPPILIAHLRSGAQLHALLDLTATAQTSPRSHWTGPNIEAMPVRSAPRPRSVISTLHDR